jgi:hypothetical protein
VREGEADQPDQRGDGEASGKDHVARPDAARAATRLATGQRKADEYKSDDKILHACSMMLWVTWAKWIINQWLPIHELKGPGRARMNR